MAAATDERFQVTASTSDRRLSPAWQRFAQGVGMELRRYEWIRSIERLGDGIGIDIDLSASGQLHLLLHPREDAMGQGLRWSLTEAEHRRWREPRLWSIGPALSAIEDPRRQRIGQNDGETDALPNRLVVTQQLMLDTDRLFGLRGDTLLTLQRAPWLDHRGGTLADHVIQLRLSWRF